MTTRRQGFGIDALDRLLGGGLLPGTLTVIAGATGAGKTQLGLRWADRGKEDEGRRGIVCDLTSRGVSKNDGAFALQHFGWELTPYLGDSPPEVALESVWGLDHPGGYF